MQPLGQERQFVVVLGCEIRFDQKQGRWFPSAMLESRLKRCIEYLEAEADLSATVVVCSGRGDSDARVTEAMVMKQYLVEHSARLAGIEAQILEENCSMNTVENGLFTFFELFRFSDAFSAKSRFSLALVTSQFHMKRSRLIFEKTHTQLRALYPQLELAELRCLDAESDNLGPEK